MIERHRGKYGVPAPQAPATPLVTSGEIMAGGLNGLFNYVFLQGMTSAIPLSHASQGQGINPQEWMGAQIEALRTGGQTVERIVGNFDALMSEGIAENISDKTATKLKEAIGAIDPNKLRNTSDFSYWKEQVQKLTELVQKDVPVYSNRFANAVEKNFPGGIHGAVVAVAVVSALGTILAMRNARVAQAQMEAASHAAQEEGRREQAAAQRASTEPAAMAMDR